MPRRGRKLKRLKKAKASRKTGLEATKRASRPGKARREENANTLIHELRKARNAREKSTVLHSLFLAVYSKGSYKQAKALSRELKKLNFNTASMLAASLTEARRLVEDIEKSNREYSSQALNRLEQMTKRENEPHRKKWLEVILQRAKRVHAKKEQETRTIGKTQGL